jgi:hypothetical protein
MARPAENAVAGASAGRGAGGAIQTKVRRTEAARIHQAKIERMIRFLFLILAPRNNLKGSRNRARER